LFCTLYYQLYQRGQENNAAKSLTSICNNSGNNEPRDVSAVRNVGGDHAINNNNCDVAVMNNVGDTEIIRDSCGIGPDVHVDNRLGVGDIVGDNDNGSPSPGGDNSFEVGQLNNIEPCDVAAVGNVGGGHAINNNHCDVAVVNNVGITNNFWLLQRCTLLLQDSHNIHHANSITNVDVRPSTTAVLYNFIITNIVHNSHIKVIIINQMTTTNIPTAANSPGSILLSRPISKPLSKLGDGEPLSISPTTSPTPN